MRLKICCSRGRAVEAEAKFNHVCGFTPLRPAGFEPGECYFDNKLELTAEGGARARMKARFRMGWLSNTVIGVVITQKTAPFASNDWSLDMKCRQKTNTMILNGSYLPSRTLFIRGRRHHIYSMATTPEALKKQAEFIATPGGTDAPVGALATMEIPGPG